MTAVSGTITNTVVGVLNNGKKIVSSTLTLVNGNTGAATFTINPVTRILGWIPTTKSPGYTSGSSLVTTFAAGTAGNTITVTPTVDASGAIYEITSVGV